MANQRDITFDVLKGIAIISVVIGHCQLYLPPPISIDGRDDLIYSFIYSYHMPLFMIISGYFSLSIFEKRIKEVVIDKFVRLGIPIISWSIIHLIYTKDITSLKSCLWFLKCLLCCYYLSRISTFNRLNKYIGMSGVVILLIILPHSNLWNLLYMYPFFVIGVILRDKMITKKLQEHFSGNVLAIIFFFLYSVQLLLWKGTYSQDNCRWTPLIMDSNWLPDFTIFLFRIVIGTTSFFSFYYIIHTIINHSTFSTKNNNCVAFVGIYSLGIYAMQTYIIDLFTINPISFIGKTIEVFITSLIVILICTFFNFLFSKNRYLNFLFLGNREYK